jgi:hypothetical protein
MKFQDDWNNIGIMLSGGADSSIIYYAACDYYKDRDDVNIYALSLNSEWKPWYGDFAADVIRITEELTGKACAGHIVDYTALHNSHDSGQEYIIGQERMTTRAIAEYNLNALYNGITLNPNIDEMTSRLTQVHGAGSRNLKEFLVHVPGRDLSRDNAPNWKNFSIDDTGCHRIRPFIQRDKMVTFEAYDYYGVIDTLYPFTYSCETRPGDNFYDPRASDDHVHCEQCWFCSERFYAFGRII